MMVRRITLVFQVESAKVYDFLEIFDASYLLFTLWLLEPITITLYCINKCSNFCNFHNFTSSKKRFLQNQKVEFELRMKISKIGRTLKRIQSGNT